MSPVLYFSPIPFYPSYTPFYNTSGAAGLDIHCMPDGKIPNVLLYRELVTSIFASRTI